MKVWCYCYRDDDSPSGTVNWYFASKREAEKARLEIETREDTPSGYQHFSTEKIEVPQRKKQLIGWLNRET